MIQATRFVVAPGWRLILKDLGVSENEVLRRANLPMDLYARKNASLSAEEYFRLWKGLEASMDDPVFPLHLAKTISTEAFSPPVFAALCSPNLNIAMERLSKYKQLIGPMTLKVNKTNKSTTVHIDCLFTDHPLPYSLIAWEIVFLVRLMRLGTREHIRPIKISSASKGVCQKAYADFLGIMPIQGKRNQIQFSSIDAERPFLTENQKVWKFFEPAFDKQLSEIQAEDTFSKRVQSSLFELLPSGLGTADSVAKKLAVSRRTLQRLLKNEGTSFRKELNHTRERLARHYLTSSTLPGAQISFLLGFDDPNSFARAFRSWTGQTPETVRSQMMR